MGTATSGAVGAIAPSPTDPNILYLGAVNGGVWGSTNAGASWKPLTDTQSSLSIGGLVVDPLNSQHVIAAIGRISASIGNGGPFTGLLSSNNGGQTWTPIAASAFPQNRPPNFDALVYAGGATIAGSNGALSSGGDTLYGGILRIDSTGAQSLVGAGLTPAAALADPAKRLAAGLAITSLVVDPHNSNIVYAGVIGAPQGQTLLNGVYESVDNGKTFARILDATTPGGSAAIQNTANLRLAAAADGTIYAVSATPTGKVDEQNVDQLFRRTAAGDWTTLALDPALALATQGSLHLLVSVDPKDSNVIYVGSSPPTTEADAAPSNLFRGVVDPLANTVAYTDIGSVPIKPHSDFRTLVFDTTGALLLGSDGGIYRNTAVATPTSAWQPIMNGYVGGELYRVAWNPIAKTSAGAFQDNGVSVQNARGSLAWTTTIGGDGLNVVVNGTTLRTQGRALTYGTSQEFGDFTRFTTDAQNQQAAPPVALNVTLDGAALPKQPFSARLVLNALDPQRFAIGGAGFFDSITAGAGLALQTTARTRIFVD